VWFVDGVSVNCVVIDTGIVGLVVVVAVFVFVCVLLLYIVYIMVYMMV